MHDRISALPESLIEQILEGLPQIERVRTSILSTRWRLLWTHVLSLKLDWGFYKSVCTCRNRSVSDYLCVINNLLLQRNKNQVLDLSLFIPSSISENDVSVGGFDQLIKCSLINGVQKLSVYMFSAARYNLPYSFFTCSTVCLTHLHLCGCGFFPPSFQGFPTLVSFELHNCRTTSLTICHFVVGCPTLQNLVLHGLYFPDQTLELDTPELRYLSVYGNFKWIFLLSADTIEEFAIDMVVLHGIWDDLPALISTLFDSMTNLKKIKIGPRFCELLAHHGDWLKLASYDGLRSLTFDDLRTKDELVYALNSIKRYPNLTEFTISLEPGSLKGDIDYDLNDYSLKCLLTVNLQYIWGSNFWMKLIERLLHCSSALKLMSLRFNSQDEWVKSVGEILMYCRASNTAKINVSNCNNFFLH